MIYVPGPNRTVPPDWASSNAAMMSARSVSRSPVGIATCTVSAVISPLGSERLHAASASPTPRIAANRSPSTNLLSVTVGMGKLLYHLSRYNVHKLSCKRHRKPRAVRSLRCCQGGSLPGATNDGADCQLQRLVRPPSSQSTALIGSSALCSHPVPLTQVAHLVVRASCHYQIAVAANEHSSTGYVIKGVTQNLVLVAAGRDPDARAVGLAPCLGIRTVRQIPGERIPTPDPR